MTKKDHQPSTEMVVRHQVRRLPWDLVDRISKQICPGKRFTHKDQLLEHLKKSDLLDKFREALAPHWKKHAMEMKNLYHDREIT